MATRVQVEELRDWTGGLSYRLDQTGEAHNATPDCLNVDFDPSGGFRLRKGVAPTHTTQFAGSLAGCRFLMPFATTTGVQQIIIGDNAIGWAYSTGGDFTTVGGLATAPQSGVTFKDRAYLLTGGSTATARWDGSVQTAMGTAFVDDVSAPTGGNFPIATTAAVWKGFVWCANLYEGATAKTNRLRWSHPNSAEDWRTLDFIDVDIGADGDSIVKIVPFRDQLLVFKGGSVHVVTGVPPAEPGAATLSVAPIARSVGCHSVYSARVTPQGVYFWSFPSGLMFWNGSSLVAVSQALKPAIDDGRIGVGHVSVGYGQNKVFVGVVWRSTRRTYVFDPLLGHGAWTVYDLGQNAGTDWRFADGSVKYVLLHKNIRYLLWLGGTRGGDQFAPSTTTAMRSFLRTRWAHGPTSASKKRYRRPRFALWAPSAYDLAVDEYKDFDTTTVKQTFHITSAPIATGTTTYFQFDVTPWGTAPFAPPSTLDTPAVHLTKGSPLGTCQAVQLVFNGPTTAIEWGVDAITYVYNTKALR